MFYPLRQVLTSDSSSVFESLVYPLDEKLEHTNRFYSSQIVEDACEKYNQKLKTTSILGEFQPSHELSVNLSNVSHAIQSLQVYEFQDKKWLNVKIELLKTPNGMILKSLLDRGIKLFLSQRAVGSVSTTGIVTSLEYFTFDIAKESINGEFI